MSEKRYCLNCGNDKAHCHCARPYLSIESANAELLGALREAVEHLDHCCPTDGWGLRDKSADSERHETLVKCRAAIERAEKGAKT